MTFEDVQRIAGWAWLASSPIWLWFVLRQPRRKRPDGYVGKFKRPDGVVIHVARMESGKLWAASDTQPPEEIGYVNGRDVMRWERLGVEPDA